MTADTYTDATADQAAADLESRSDAEAVRLAQTLDAADVAAAMHGTARAVARALHGSTEETTARADALARALRAISRGLDVEHAVNVASRDAVRDATRRAAAETLWSLDATTSDSGTTLADLLDAGSHMAARLTHYDDAAGIYRGVARVPHPEDCTRPLEMPAPADMANAARASLTPEAVRLLDVTAAVNVAAEQQRREYVAALAAYVATADADAESLARASRSTASAKAERKAAAAVLKHAKSDAKAEHNPYRPRTAEVAAVLIPGTARGARTVKLGEDQAAANEAYWTHRDALAAVALEAWTERLDAAADDQRARRDNRRARRHTAPRLARLTTYQAIHSARQHRAATVRTAQAATCPLSASQPPAAPAVGRTLADPRDADHGTRPRRSLAEWDATRALPGSTRRPTARLASPNAPAADPTRSRTHADAERTHRQPAPSTAPAPRAYVPGPSAPAPVLTRTDGAPFGYACTPADLAEFAHRRAVARVLQAFGILPAVALHAAYRAA